MEDARYVKVAPRVLVAEDNPANQRLVEIILVSLGYDVRIVDDGAAALRALDSDRFDVVLMDLRMPVLNGFATARAIRELPDERANIPIIAVTADVRPRVEADAIAAGMNACLFKPLDVTRLTDLVSAWAGAGPEISRSAGSR